MRIAIVINTAWNIYNFRSGLIRTLQKEGHEIHAIAPEDAYSVKLTAMGCVYHPISMKNTGNNPWDELILIGQLFRLYREVKPQVVLHYTIKPNIYGSLVARLLRIPSISTVSGLGTVFLTNAKSNSIARMLYRIAFRYPQKIFFQNASDMEIFKQQRLLKAINYSLVPGSGIDIRRFVKYQSTPEAPPFVFLMVARLIEEKGVREFMKASEILTEQGFQLNCQILGPQEKNHSRNVSLEDLASSPVTYLGETDDVKHFIDKSHAIVLPSFREGLSRSLLEAAAMEKPIIASRVPGCMEVVKDEINGLLCTPGDPHDLALKMKAMLSYPQEKLEQMGRAGRKLVEQQYTEDHVNGFYLEVINKTNHVL
jgi:glycosyltransferase involved in cell wall biosynthesis